MEHFTLDRGQYTRQVYTTLLTNWMGVNGDKILGRKFETLGFA